MSPQFSLIISTLNRTWQLERFLKHLKDEDFCDYECIIVDQNDDDRLSAIIDKYKDQFAIIHMHSGRGISLGRNTGVAAASGEILAFPDDDCWYGGGVLNQVIDLFDRHPDIDLITGRTIDSKGKTSLGKFDRCAGKITKRNVFKRGNTSTFFLKRSVAEEIKFDENLGPGPQSKWGSGEETDFLLQALAAGFNLHYDHEFTVHHDEPVKEYSLATIQRGYDYGRGMGGS